MGGGGGKGGRGTVGMWWGCRGGGGARGGSREGGLAVKEQLITHLDRRLSARGLACCLFFDAHSGFVRGS